MYTKKQTVINRIAAAQRYAAKHFSTVSFPEMKHIVLVGPPGSRKVSVLEAIMKYGSATYEKVRMVTNRERFPGESKQTHIFTKQPLAEATGLKIIEGTAYAIGQDEYGISLSELTQIIARGKKCILFANITAALALKEFFPGSIMLVYLDASEKKREEALNKKFDAILRTVTSPARKAKLLKKIPVLLDFGNKEIAHYTALRKEEEKTGSFTFYYVEHTKMFNPHQAARFIFDNAQLTYEEKTQVA